MALEKELETFKKQLPALLGEHRGEWALVNVDQEHVHLSIWHCYADALKLGYERFGLKPFLVKQILPETTTRFFLGMAGEVVDGVFKPDSVSLLDKPVDEHCYVDLPHDSSIK